MPADDFIDLILIREFGLTHAEAASIPEWIRVFAAEFLAE